MATLAEWPELVVVTKEQRFELVLKSLDSQARTPTLSDDGLQKMVFEKNHQLNFISIAGCGMSYLSPSIVSCLQLTKLVIIRNELASVPEEIGTLSKLVFIDLSNNKLERLPGSFSKLTKLETLVVSGNQLTNDGLFDFSAIESLHVLDLSYNNLTAVPPTLMCGKLVHLHTLNLAHNKITDVAQELNIIEHMKTLNLSENEITSLPWAIGQMEKIKVLDLSQNPFKDGRFKKLANDKRAKVSAVIAYIAKNAPKAPKSSPAEAEATEATVSKESADEGALLVRIGAPNMYVKRMESVTSIRPFLACCVFNNLDLTGENFKKFINIQTKLHASSLCANREIAAIGTHELKSFNPPLKYLALPRDELHITALHKKKPVSARELIEALVRVYKENDDMLSVFPDKNDLSSLNVRREYVQNNEGTA
ncbi:Leucine Rich repeat-containing domain protein [Trichostrongylus colubriformis]|uniref:Leucine Rich repeat-containing domain protein n=1 Tax=Trichostrongylus colubriformis TaxID=6319 RepID=A0AAN8FYQ4_TRICO